VPKTCDGSCGDKTDGCGNVLHCGGCGAGMVCGQLSANICNLCQPQQCPANKQCGTTTDGCGGEANCGVCSAGETCINNLCCKPKTCSDTDVRCDVTDDGCGHKLDCSCQAPYVCNPVSGDCCTPIACVDVCKQGDYDGSDGCGSTIHCDACPEGPQ
jgi:hypothetical protein